VLCALCMYCAESALQLQIGFSTAKEVCCVLSCVACALWCVVVCCGMVCLVVARYRCVVRVRVLTSSCVCVCVCA